MIKRLFVLLLAICFFPQGVMPESVEETYAGAVHRLNQEGFEGIDSALEVFKAILRSDPDFIKAYLSASDAYMLKYEFSENKDKKWLDAALNYLNAAIGKEKNLPAAYFKRAVIHFDLKETDKAAADLKKAMEISPTYLDARILYLQYLISTKKSAEAVEFAHSSVNLFPGDPAPLKYFGDLFFKEGEYEEAINFYKRVVSLVPNAPNTHFSLGKAYQNLGKCADAIESFRKALAQNADLFEAHFNLANCYSETGRLKEATEHLKTYLKNVPKDVSALNNLAILYEQTGDVKKARLTWLKVKGATDDKVYKERADQHLYILLSSKNKRKVSLKEKAALPKKRGEKDGEKK